MPTSCVSQLVLVLLAILLAAPASAEPGRAIATGGNPASLVVWGKAEAVAVLADGTVLAARGPVGRGRAVAIGHGGFLEDDRGDTRAFLAEQLAWLASARTGGAAARPPRPGREVQVRAWGVPPALASALSDRGVAIEAVGGPIEQLDLARLDLLVASPQAFARAGRFDDLAGWLTRGGALLSVETAWGQLQLRHAASIDDLAANRLLTRHGIRYTERALSPGRDGVYTLDGSAAAAANAEQALRVLAGEAEGDRTVASRVAREALAVAPLRSPVVAAADRLAGAHAEAIEAAYRSMATRPLKPAEQPLAAALLDLAARRAAEGDAPAHPSAAAFPGEVPASAPRISAQRQFADRLPGWRSTGLYAAPGEAVSVRVRGRDLQGAQLQIGCWLDPQQFDERVRLPIAVFREPIVGGRATLASPIGGPVYLDLTAEAAQHEVTVEIAGAVEMPRFRLGHTDLAEWRARIRHLPAPWAELESDALVFTLPAEVVRTLDDPAEVMEHWNRVHAAMQALEPRSPRHWPDRQYRFVAEKRLSWGYMYCPSDAPIVIPMTEAAPIVEVANFDAEGPNRLWGQYHEMGHAHQNPLWTFEGTGEVTVNIFTVLALNTVNGYPLDHEAMRSEPGRARATMIRHMREGSPFEKWKRDPFLALQTYALLWHTFGWEAFHRTFRAYDAMPAAMRPRSDLDKRDRFVIEFSRAVGRNLGPYFSAWGVPISDRVDRDVGELPVWMPEGIEAPARGE